MPKDNAPDYPTSAPQSKGNSGELFRSAQYAVLEPAKLPVRAFGSRQLVAGFPTAAGSLRCSLALVPCTSQTEKDSKVQVTVLTS
jgi:hypothetical protein